MRSVLVFALVCTVVHCVDDSGDYDFLYEDFGTDDANLNVSIESGPNRSNDSDASTFVDYDPSNDYLEEDYLAHLPTFQGLGNSQAVELLPRDTAELLATELDVEKESSVSLAKFANAHPYAIDKFSLEQLEAVLLRSQVIHRLTNATLIHLIHSQAVVDKLGKLPMTTIAAMVSSNPNILTSFSSDEKDFAARILTRKLLRDPSFLKRIPLPIHAYLAETNFRHFLTPDDFAMIVRAHPELPKHLGPHGRKLIPQLITEPLFVSKLPCKAVVTVANNTELLKTLTAKEFAVLARSKHVWNCLPSAAIRSLAENPHLGRSVGMGELFAAYRLLSKDKRNDKTLLWNLLTHQLSPFARANFLPTYYWSKLFPKDDKK